MARASAAKAIGPGIPSDCPGFYSSSWLTNIDGMKDGQKRHKMEENPLSHSCHGKDLCH